MRLTLPEGFQPPANARPGEPFEVVATLEPTEDGGFQLTAIDGMEVPGEDEEVDERVDASKVNLPFEGDDEYT